MSNQIQRCPEDPVILPVAYFCHTLWQKYLIARPASSYRLRMRTGSEHLSAPHSNRLSEDERTYFRLWLQREFTERCKRNSRYSLRAFAKFLQMDASTLSQILSGKRIISKKQIQRLCDQLGTSVKDMRRFGLGSGQTVIADDFAQINLDTFAVISDWYHYAILELTFVRGFKPDPKWISRKLSITVEEAKVAVERLLRLRLLLPENGSYVKAAQFVTNQTSVNTSAAQRSLQHQIIEKALFAIENCEPDRKDITSMTMSVDPANLAKARVLAQKFRREMCALLDDGEATEVYNLAIQLYPLTTNEENP